MSFDLQPTLTSATLRLTPLRESDFERLYAVASDPLIWEQHPNKNRYQREVFENFFKGAMESKGAFLISDANTGEVLGSSRFYDLSGSNVLIGYTFLSRSCWGKGVNREVKNLMLTHAFQFVDEVLFHVGESNVRSKMAMQKIGGVKIGTENIEYYGEPLIPNVIFSIKKLDWQSAVNGQNGRFSN